VKSSGWRIKEKGRGQLKGGHFSRKRGGVFNKMKSIREKTKITPEKNRIDEDFSAVLHRTYCGSRIRKGVDEFDFGQRVSK